jgi:hypothetical protein
MYCRMMLGGAPPQDAADRDGDRRYPCMMCRFTRPVNFDRSRRYLVTKTSGWKVGDIKVGWPRGDLDGRGRISVEGTAA